MRGAALWNTLEEKEERELEERKLKRLGYLD
jgi:hypothetical protein